MKRNVGTADRIVRLILMIAFIALGIAVGGVLGIVFYVLAAVMLLTAVVGTCPLYAPFGINTCSTKGGGATA